MARARTGEAGNGPTGRERKPYGRLTPKQWGDLLALYEAGATAKALAVRFNTTERTIYTHARKAKLLRKDRPWMEPCALDDVVLEDRTAAGLSPDGWAGRVKAAVDDWPGARVVLETNQGGAMGESVLRNCGLTAPVRRVHATTGKVTRAEPVAALYEQGRVAHAAGLEPLEEELLGLGADDAGGRSPDRADALVWAITELSRPPWEGPRLTQL